jgi:hypothetical protein
MRKTYVSNIVATAFTIQVIITTSFKTSEIKYLTWNTKKGPWKCDRVIDK